jgi:hypothetical protein
MPKFRTGTDDFAKLIDQGGYFVDKSLLIRSVIEGNDVILLPRPRRFGKTLNMTMLRYFFEKTEEDKSYLFEGLEITNDGDCMAHQGQYPVIYLSLKDVKGLSWIDAASKIIEKVADLYKVHSHISDSLPKDHEQQFQQLAYRQASIKDYELSLKNLISYL